MTPGAGTTVSEAGLEFRETGDEGLVRRIGMGVGIGTAAAAAAATATAAAALPSTVAASAAADAFTRGFGKEGGMPAKRRRKSGDRAVEGLVVTNE